MTVASQPEPSSDSSSRAYRCVLEPSCAGMQSLPRDCAREVTSTVAEVDGDRINDVEVSAVGLPESSLAPWSCPGTRPDDLDRDDKGRADDQIMGLDASR